MRKAREEGPQVITLRSDAAVVVVTTDQYQKLKRKPIDIDDGKLRVTLDRGRRLFRHAMQHPVKGRRVLALRHDAVVGSLLREQPAVLAESSSDV